MKSRANISFIIEMNRKKLVVIVGPTGVGKTEFCLSLAKSLDTDIISSDSRQIYRNMTVGTAAPDEAQLAAVKHHFVGILEPDEYYSAARFEEDVMSLLSTLFLSHDVVIMTGGSMMYIDAVCNGIDDVPTVDDETRAFIIEHFEHDGLEQLAAELRLLDPEYYYTADIKNPKRVMHALEICYMTGKPYSFFLKNKTKSRDFDIIKIGLTRPREELYERIGRRVDCMIADGLVAEAERLLPFRKCNALNTVGYKEIFSYLDGDMSLQEAADKIKQNTRIYARKQMTWFKRDENIAWFSPEDRDGIIACLRAQGVSV